jgi:hypothetical protein
MTDTLPDGYVVHLPALKHHFEDPVWVPAAKSASGRPQTERTCKVCGAVKVTLHGDDHGRAWRVSADAEQIETFTAPVCVPKQVVA